MSTLISSTVTPSIGSNALTHLERYVTILYGHPTTPEGNANVEPLREYLQGVNIKVIRNGELVADSVEGFIDLLFKGYYTTVSTLIVQSKFSYQNGLSPRITVLTQQNYSEEESENSLLQINSEIKGTFEHDSEKNVLRLSSLFHEYTKVPIRE